MRPTYITDSTTLVRCIRVPAGYPSFRLTEGTIYKVLTVYATGLHITDNMGMPMYVPMSHFIPATPSAIYKRRR